MNESPAFPPWRRSFHSGFRRLLAAAFLIQVLMAFFTRPALARLPDPYKLEADYIIFSIDSKVITCIGNARFNYRSISILAGQLAIDVDTDYLTASGNVLVSNGAIDQRVADDEEEETLRNLQGATGTAALAVAGSPDQTILAQGGGQPVNPIIAEENEAGEFFKVFEGDSMVFDMRNIAFVVYQTRNEVRKIRLRGEDMREVAALVNVDENYRIDSDPIESKGNITATRMKVSPGDKYEAWNSAIYIEGTKVLSLPYWTNSGKGMIPGSFKLRKVRYSTNQNWFVATQYRYSENERRKGFLNLSYSGNGTPTWGLDLEQRMTVGKKTSLQFNLDEIARGSLRHSFNIFRQLKGRNSIRMNFSDQRKSARDVRFSFDGAVKSASIRFSASRTESKVDRDSPGAANSRYDLSVNARPKYLDDKRRYMGILNMDTGYSRSSKTDNEEFAANLRFTALRSGDWRIGKTATLDADANLNLGRIFKLDGPQKDFQNSGYSFRARLKRKLGNSKLFSLNYSHGETRNGGANKDHRQSLGGAFSFSKSPLWTLRLSSNYDFQTETMTSARYSLDYRFNKRFDASTVGSWNFQQNEMQNVTYTARYDLHGIYVNANWYTDGNEFILDVASPVK